MKTVYKAQLLQKRKWRIRKKVVGTAARPRLSVKFSGKHIYAQAVNDDAGSTLVFLSTLDGELRKGKTKGNVSGAKSLGSAFAAKAKAAKADVVDDISLISGVGPVLKAKLTEAGFGTLVAISKLKKADIAKLDEELSLGGRIEREEWVAQAKELLAGKPPRAQIDKDAAAGKESE